MVSPYQFVPGIFKAAEGEVVVLNIKRAPGPGVVEGVQEVKVKEEVKVVFLLTETETRVAHGEVSVFLQLQLISVLYAVLYSWDEEFLLVDVVS